MPGVRPQPGPSAAVVHRVARSSSASAASGARPPSASAQASVIGSSTSPATTGCCDAGTAATHQAGAGPQRRRAHITIAPVMPREPPMASTLPASYLEPNDGRPRQARDDLLADQHRGRRHDHARRDADRHHDQAAGALQPGQHDVADLGRVERDRHVGGDRERRHLAGRGVDAARHVDRQHRPAARRRSRGSPRPRHRVARRCEPVPSSASTTTSAPRSPSPTAPTRETGTPAAPPTRRRRGRRPRTAARPRRGTTRRRRARAAGGPRPGRRRRWRRRRRRTRPGERPGTGRARRARRPPPPPPSAACRARRR